MSTVEPRLCDCWRKSKWTMTELDGMMAKGFSIHQWMGEKTMLKYSKKVFHMTKGRKNGRYDKTTQQPKKNSPTFRIAAVLGNKNEDC